jgi:hypothetical protein
MMETFIMGIFVVLALVFLAALAFLAWLVFMIVRSLYRGVKGAVKLPAKVVKQMSPAPRLTPAPKTTPQLQYFPVRAPEISWSRCPRERCRTPNPSEAQFCRRCGMNLVAAKVGALPTNGRMLARA